MKRTSLILSIVSLIISITTIILFSIFLINYPFKDDVKDISLQTSGGGSGDPCPDTPTVKDAEGNVYKTVQIGDQCWMAENLKVGTRIDGSQRMSDNGVIEKYCYDDDPANCELYGGLYQWNELMAYETREGAQGICPEGWHVPSDNEWKILEGTVDSQYNVGDTIWDNEGYRGFDVGKNLKSTSGWHENRTVIDLYCFSALPGRYRSSNDNRPFSNFGYTADFWSSTEHRYYDAWWRVLFCNVDEASRNTSNKWCGLSLRCVKD